MMKCHNIIILMIICLLLPNCKHNNNTASKSDNMEYAQWLDIEHYDSYTQVTVRNPWNAGSALQTYCLVPRDNAIPSNANGTIIKVPVQSALVYSSVHGGIIKELGALQSITGVCDAQYFDMPEIKQLVADGRIVDAGNSMQPTIERIVQLRPDAIILSPFQNGGYGALTSLGTPIIECADYMENTPLGRAEWIKLFGELYCCRAKADSIFSSVVKQYTTVKALTDSISWRPKVISETVTSGVWFMPGGDSYMAHLYIDAGADYPWSSDTSTGSLSLNFEQVYATAHDADIWLIKSLHPMSYDEFAAQYPLNTKFKAFKERHIYQCPSLNTSLYRDFPFHPEVLLREYVRIFHPDILAEPTQYFKPMTDK